MKDEKTQKNFKTFLSLFPGIQVKVLFPVKLLVKLDVFFFQTSIVK